MKLKKIHEQTIVITGASSGIGLVTAREAARQGARLVLTARSEDALRQLASEINTNGGQAAYVVADIADEAQVKKISETALDRFGGFDTWVNNAGVSIYGKILDVSIEDMRRLFETNFWGVVYGSTVAARHLRTHGGALINIGSTLSDRAIPIQGIYCASKHAVKGFTDSLRMELEAEKAPVSVTLVKPGAINTPYPEHASNYLGVEPKNPAPVYAPEVVAEVILHCAAHPVRDAFAGGGGKAISFLGHYAPRTTDKMMERTMIQQQQSDLPASPQSHRGLYEASGELRERGRYSGHVSESSLYSKASLHPGPTVATLVAVGAAVTAAALLSPRSKRLKF